MILVFQMDDMNCNSAIYPQEDNACNNGGPIDHHQRGAAFRNVKFLFLSASGILKLSSLRSPTK